MTPQEYEQCKRECWLDLALDTANMNKVTIEEYKRIFNGVFDKAYAIGKQEKDADTVIRGWVARDDYNNLKLFENKPMKYRYNWEDSNGEMPIELFSELTYNDDPIEVELIIKRKKK